MARNIEGIQLPSEVEEALNPQDAKPSETKLALLGKLLVEKREEAARERKQSGIEESWLLAEEAYNGIDDANRHEYMGSRWVKPLALNAPVTTGGTTRGTEDKRSTAFVRLTSRYVDAGAAKVCEILLPIDDKPFSFEPTPVPDLIEGQKDHSQLKDAQGKGLTRPARPDELTPAMQYGQPVGVSTPAQGAPAPGGAPPQGAAAPAGGQVRVPLTTQDVAEEAVMRAREQAKKAEMRIFDWMVECQHHREMRKVIGDAARIGVGVLKGPFPSHRKAMAVTKDKDGKPKLTIRIDVVPADKWVDPWNVFPDPACGENIANGDYCFEREYFSEKQVRDLKKLPGYLHDQIDQVIELGPGKHTTDARNPNEKENKHQYEAWYFHGTLKREDFEVANKELAQDVPMDQKEVFAIVTIINGLVVKAALNALDTGRLPYHSVPWQRRSGYWAGIGVGEQIMVPQRITNASTRALLNNAGISAGPQIVINQSGIKPANGEWFLTPNKIWYLSNEAPTDDVRKAFTFFEVPNVGKQLMEVIQYGMRLAEESSSIPLVTQGMSGPTSPDTLGATQLQNNNANQLLRAIGYTFDDFITDPLVDMYYEYLLLDPKIPDEEKGDFRINAHGSVALVERSIQDQTIAQMTPLAENPIFGVNPKKWFAVLARSKHLDPSMFMYSPEEQQKLDSAPKPPPPIVQAAQVRAQTEKARMDMEMQQSKDQAQLEQTLAQMDSETQKAVEQMRAETSRLRTKMDTDRDQIYVQTEAQRAQAEFQQRVEELRLKKEIAIADYATKHQMSLEQVKSKLADTAMKLRTQKELALMDTQLELHKHHTLSATDTMKPPVQSPGRAKPGKAFSQV